MRKRLAVAGVILLVIGVSLGNEALAAEKFPVKPINFIVPLEAGSDGDLLSRPFAQRASAVMGQPIVIVNKPGAGSTIGAREVYNAKPDGYTVGMAAVTLITNKLQGLMPYDHNDYTLLGMFYTFNHIMIGSTKTARPFKTIEEVIAYAKTHPGEVKLSVASVGQSLWIAAMAFMDGTGLDFNAIPQAGAGGQTTLQAAGGHADIAVVGLGSAKAQIDAGNARLLAVIGPKRALPPYQYAPTLREIGYDISWDTFGILIGPPKMAKEATDKLVNAFEIAANDPTYSKFLNERNVYQFYLPPDKMVGFLDERQKQARRIMEKAGILKK
jgi:tripartite-type tricarboxylate transporter receptor subunit TctC